jgi:hypothetical protein
MMSIKNIDKQQNKKNELFRLRVFTAVITALFLIYAYVMFNAKQPVPQNNHMHFKMAR